MKRIVLSCAILLSACVATYALDYATATGADLVKENASKESGYSSAQLEVLQEKLQGRTLTFENGKVWTVRKRGDAVLVTVAFTDPQSRGMFPESFKVTAKVTDPAAMKEVEQYDEGIAVKTLTGKVARKGMMQFHFELTDAKIVPAEKPSAKPLFDPDTVTGADLVKGNAAKESGYSSAQREKLQEQLQGKTLTFENGKVWTVRKRGDAVWVTVSFADPQARGMFPRSFKVSAKVMDPEAMKEAEQYDEGLAIKKLTGIVARKGRMQMFFELTNVKIEPAEKPSAKPMFDPDTVTGADLVKGNAAKESGYSSAQREKLQEQLQGKTLTFENGKVWTVRKRGDAVLVTVAFADPQSRGMFPRSFKVLAKVTDPAAMKEAEQYDEGLAVKTLTGEVARKGMMQTFFELTNAKIEPAEKPSAKPLFDPDTVTGADLVKGNAAKESGYSSAQREKLQEQLQGKTLTFENGKVWTVHKHDDAVLVTVVFTDPQSRGMFPASFKVEAKVTDPAAMKEAAQYDEGLAIKKLTGIVARKGRMQMFFELTDAKITPAR